MRGVPKGLEAAWTEAMSAALRQATGGLSLKDRERAWKLVIFAPRILMAVTGARGGRGANGRRAKTIQRDIGERLHAYWQ
eukprot:10990898-Alexandrium_andersonii.AAC.1